jgi:hypothetical protein
MSREERKLQHEEFQIRLALTASGMVTESQQIPGWLLSYDIHPTFTPWKIWHIYEDAQGYRIRHQKLVNFHEMEIQQTERPLSPTESLEFATMFEQLLSQLPLHYSTEQYARDGTHYNVWVKDIQMPWEHGCTGGEILLKVGAWVVGRV